MPLQLKKAQRKSAYLRLGISAPSGGGKTLGSLLIAYGLLKEKYPNMPEDALWEKIAVIDTENGSAELYVGSEVGNVKIGSYNVITLQAPFTADKYTGAIELCEQASMEVCIIDSSSHLWSGEGGLLEQQGNISKRVGNSYTAWREITPQHNRFVETMLQSPMHIIATMRSKQEYVQEKDEGTGKHTVRKLGLEPVQRQGMEYEFTTFMEINAEHEAFGSKDRTSLFDQKTFKITPKVGRDLMRWLSGGTDDKEVVVAQQELKKPDGATEVSNIRTDIIKKCTTLGGSKNPDLMAFLKTYHPSGNPNSITDPVKLKELFDGLNDLEQTQI